MWHCHRPPPLRPMSLRRSQSYITFSKIHFRNMTEKKKKERSYLNLKQGANILLFITNKISRTDSKFLICFSPSKISALNYPERILLPANLFQFPVQNRPHNIVRSFLWRLLSDSSIIEGTHPPTHVPLPPIFRGGKGKWIGSVRFVCGALPSFSA